MCIEIKKMEEKDLPVVMQIEKESFANPWSKTLFLNEIKDDFYGVYFIAIKKGKICGYIGGWFILDELHITNLAVAKKYRKQGVATVLIKYLIKKARKGKISYALLEVRESNRAALKLYKKHGFVNIARRKNYYQKSKEDALIMKKVFDYEQ